MIILKGGTVVGSKKSEILDVKLEGEKILEVGKNLDTTGGKVIDVTGKLLFPGFIDTHTHFDLDTGTFHTADDFATGTRGAIVGGTTCILDFATQNKGETLKEALENWHRMADHVSSCDYGFHMAITEWNEAVSKELPYMTEKGITSYKLYMAYDNLRVTDEEIYTILKEVDKQGGIIGVHCENGDIVNARIAENKAAGRGNVKYHPLTRPDIVEAEAIYRYMMIGKMAGTPIYIVHLSTKKGYERIMEARKEGQEVYIETCPQYLCMDDSRYELPGFEGAKYVMSPPLRKMEDRECLWEAIQKNEVDFIGTDHCSFNFKGQKDYFGTEDYSKIPNGGPGVEHRGLLLYTYGVKTGRITKEQMCGQLSENAAKMFGMYPQKGIIAPGSDADLVILNPDETTYISAKTQEQNVDYTPYEGIVADCKIETVYLRGEKVVDQGKICKEKQGKYIARDKCVVKYR
ncbi:MAG: dihydropyrimidinase [Acetivibrio sp.]